MRTEKIKNPQISAHISPGLKSRFDELSQVRGLRKAFVLEQALLYHFRALEELPEEVFIPARIVLSENEFTKIQNAMENPPQPTQAMQELMNGVSNWMADSSSAAS